MVNQNLKMQTVERVTFCQQNDYNYPLTKNIKSCLDDETSSKSGIKL